MNDLASLLLFQGLSFAYYALAQLSSRYAKIYVCLHQKIFTELGVAPLEVSRNRSSALPRRHYLIVIDVTSKNCKFSRELRQIDH